MSPHIDPNAAPPRPHEARERKEAVEAHAPAECPKLPDPSALEMAPRTRARRPAKSTRCPAPAVMRMPRAL